MYLNKYILITCSVSCFIIAGNKLLWHFDWENSTNKQHAKIYNKLKYDKERTQRIEKFLEEN